MARNCAGCGTDNPLAFYAGITKWCKGCWRKRVKANRMANADYYRQYDRERNDEPERVQARRDYAARQRLDADHKVKDAARTKQWQQANAEKRQAHVLVGNAIRSGKLTVQPCERCGYGVGVQAHHEDYSKPLDVTWLCKPCHGQRHREINEERRRSA